MRRDDKETRVASIRYRSNALRNAIREGVENGRSPRKAQDIMKATKARPGRG